ncbi:unnamed protein product [Acanthoscelides obtectus]|nr:unnamed protein product [Acanthoscelides obtectus]CAK1625046.1 hypothetical protein AOBTE_LOCUS2908 [Acanthoscelides obtectus]
MHHLRV